MGEFLAKLFGIGRKRDDFDHFEDEIEHHIESIAEESMARGMSREAAYDKARREFGNRTRVAEKARESWRFRPLDELMQDVRLALRAMRRAPVLSLVILVTLALGIGATTAIFSVVHGVVLKPLPYPDADRLVWLGESTQKTPGISVTWLNFQHWKQENRTFEAMAAFRFDQKIVKGGREAAFVPIRLVSSGYPALLGMKPQLGRLLTESDDAPGAPLVAVLSDAFWRRHFGADPAVIGSTIELDGKAYQAVGVAEPFWQFGPKSEILVALGPTQTTVTDRSQHGSMRAVGRLKPGVTAALAQADLDRIMNRLSTADPGPEIGHLAFAQLLTKSVTGDVGQSLWALMMAAGLLLLIACGNVAGLLVARNLSRYSEIAIRMAIGAGRGRLIRELMTESLLFSVMGGAAGVFVAYWLTGVLRSSTIVHLPRLATIAVSREALAFAVAVTILSGLIAGLAPVLSAQRGINLVEAMQGATRSATSNRRAVSMRAGLVVAQVGITLVLVFGSVVLLRSLAAAQNRNPGFEAERLWAMDLILPGSAYPNSAAVTGFYENLQRNIAVLPGVEKAALVLGPPSLGSRMDWFYSIVGKPEPKRGDVPAADLTMAGPGYFATAGIRMRAGREFTEQDRKGAPCVAIVNDVVARDQLEVGSSIKMGGPYMKGDVCQVVGIASGVSQEGLDSPVEPEIFLPFAQSPSQAMAMLIRMRNAGDAEATARQIRSEVARLGPGVPVQSLTPMTEALRSTLERRRSGTLLLAAFAGLALALAAIGIYGLLEFWVGMRTREIALRMALGASRGAIFRFAGWQTGRLILAGCALGLVGAYASSRWLASLVYGTSAGDWSGLTVAALAMLALGGMASAVPLWRAVRVSEAEQLHRGS